MLQKHRKDFIQEMLNEKRDHKFSDIKMLEKF